MKLTAKYNCDCVEKIQEVLKEHNTTFDTAFTLGDGEVFLQLAVCKIDPKKRGKAKSVLLPNSFCPFCGTKTKDEEAANPQFSLTDDQQTALVQLQEFIDSNELLFRVEGYAGTGKSFLVSEFCKWLNSQKIQYIAACPTNKAAKNLRNIALAAGIDLEVRTVAQLLGQQPVLNEETGKEEFVSGDNTSIGDYQVVIVDEFSMVNRDNFKEIVKEARIHDTQLIFVGDRAQLPPINEKEPMAAKEYMPAAVLNKIVRYDGEIARVAEAVRSSKDVPDFFTAADETIICLSESEWFKKAMELFKSAEYKADMDYVRFLAWRNKTVRSLNNYVRLHLWGEGVNPYIPGDRLIALTPFFRPKPGARGKNKWRIFLNNSEEATVTKEGVLKELKFNKDIYRYWEVMVIPEGATKEHKLLILHKDSKQPHEDKLKYYCQKKMWSSYFDLSRLFDNVGYAYALTTHKAQGSSIEHVFLDVADMMRSGDRQNLIYTALTRAKRQAFILD